MKHFVRIIAVLLVCLCVLSVSAFADCAHSPVVDDYVAPTCTNYGLTSGVHCGICSEILIEQEIIYPFGHVFNSNGICVTCSYVCPHTDLLVYPEIPATCRLAGTGESVVCADCGRVMVPGKKLPKLPHEPWNGICLKCDSWVSEYVIQYHLTNAVPESLKAIYGNDAALRAGVLADVGEQFGEYFDRCTTFVLTGDAWHRYDNVNYKYSQMKDADFPQNGIPFRMVTPEGYDKYCYDVALYHINAEGKAEPVDFTIEACNIITNMKDTNPYVLVMYPTELTGEVKLLSVAHPNFGVVANFIDSNNCGKNLYQWRLDGEDIPGATGAEYVVKESDLGHELTCAIRSNIQTGEKVSEPVFCE